MEIKTTAALQHPHILPLFDSGTADGFLYYVMPFIDGETLRAKLSRETQLGIDEAVRITTQVADALDYAHRHGVIHRDIKPENILLHDGRPMVADFGIALAVSAAAGGRMTETGLSLGTPHYMSPEQATADKEITGRSDIYSLASVLYEMLSGSPPHVGASAQQIISKIVTEDAAPVTKLRKSVPPNVAAAVAKALERLPADRFATAGEFAAALGNPAFTTQATTYGKGASPASLARNPLVLLLGLVAVMTSALAAWGWLRRPPPKEVSRYSIRLPEGQSFGYSEQSRIALSPDGRVLVYVGCEHAGALRPDGRAGSTRSPRNPSMAPRAPSNPSFSPDGQRVLFIQGTPLALRAVPLAGGPPVTLTDSLVDTGGTSWGFDGYVYYDGHLAGDGKSRVRETGGVPEPVSHPDSTKHESWHFQPQPLPDGEGLLFTIALNTGAEWAVGAMKIGDSKHTTLVKGQSPRYEGGYLFYVTSGGVLMSVPFDSRRLAMVGTPVPVAEESGAGGKRAGGPGDRRNRESRVHSRRGCARNHRAGLGWAGWTCDPSTPPGTGSSPTWRSPRTGSRWPSG